MGVTEWVMGRVEGRVMGEGDMVGVIVVVRRGVCREGHLAE